MNLYRHEEVFEERFSLLMRALQYAGEPEEKATVFVEMIAFFFVSEDLQKVDELLAFLEDNNFFLQNVCYYRGLIEDDKGNLDGAEELYYKAIDQDENFNKPYFALGFLYDRKGDFEKALFYYKEYSDMLGEKGLEDPTVYNDIGSIYIDMGYLEDAKVYLDKSLANDPNFFRALYNMGLYYYKKGDNENALAYYERTIDAEPFFMNSYLNISAIYIADERYDEAIEVLTRGINKNPSPDLLYNRACSYAKTYLYDRALDDLKRAYHYDKDIFKYAIKDKDFEAMDLRGIFEGGNDDIY